ncbi:MAG TPA: mechanosensitive ion channel family protein [Candidatus Krumholzibacterium sp.]|nr:mechanosensitive ion channel family protein [Candidatus Krumholzibacterium sp.]
MMFKDILQRVYLGNSVQSYLICLGIFIGGLIVVRILTTVVLHRMKKMAEKTRTSADDILFDLIGSKLSPLFYVMVLYLSVKVLALSSYAYSAIRGVYLLSLMIFGVRFVLGVLNFGLDLFMSKRDTDESKKKAVKGILVIARFIIWVVALVILLDNLGIKVTGLIAGLGIGGIAIALAAQAILGDLFSYFTIFFDRPFEIGDFIILGDFKGTVEYIGIKTSRLRSLSGEEIVISNTDLTSSRVRNYKRMEQRRVLFNLGVTYDTPVEKMKKAVELIKRIIEEMEGAELDRSHFSSYGDFNLVIETVYFVNSRDYNTYMDIHEGINLRIKEEFQREGIEFAFPTQTIHLAGNKPVVE